MKIKLMKDFFSFNLKRKSFLYFQKQYNRLYLNSSKTIMQILGKLLLLIVVVCYISTAYGKPKNVQNTVVEQATKIKDNVVKTVSDGAKTGAKVAGDAAKTAG